MVAFGAHAGVWVNQRGDLTLPTARRAEPLIGTWFCAEVQRDSANFRVRNSSLYFRDCRIDPCLGPTVHDHISPFSGQCFDNCQSDRSR